MKEFCKFAPGDGVICYRLVFDKDEYVAVFEKPLGSDSPIYSRMEYRKHGEKKFSILNERVWSLAISQALQIIEGLDKLEIDPNAGLFKVD